jgi:hypothetical protein
LSRRDRADLGDLLGRGLWVADETEERHQREKREERQQPVIGQRGCPVTEVVLAELRERALERGNSDVP